MSSEVTVSPNMHRALVRGLEFQHVPSASSPGLSLLLHPLFPVFFAPSLPPGNGENSLQIQSHRSFILATFIMLYIHLINDRFTFDCNTAFSSAGHSFLRCFSLFKIKMIFCSGTLLKKHFQVTYNYTLQLSNRTVAKWLFNNMQQQCYIRYLRCLPFSYSVIIGILGKVLHLFPRESTAVKWGSILIP